MKKQKLLKYVFLVLKTLITIVFLLTGSGKFQADTIWLPILEIGI